MQLEAVDGYFYVIRENFDVIPFDINQRCRGLFMFAKENLNSQFRSEYWIIGYMSDTNMIRFGGSLEVISPDLFVRNDCHVQVTRQKTEDSEQYMLETFNRRILHYKPTDVLDTSQSFISHAFITLVNVVSLLGMIYWHRSKILLAC